MLRLDGLCVGWDQEPRTESSSSSPFDADRLRLLMRGEIKCVRNVDGTCAGSLFKPVDNTVSLSEVEWLLGPD